MKPDERWARLIMLALEGRIMHLVDDPSDDLNDAQMYSIGAIDPEGRVTLAAQLRVELQAEQQALRDARTRARRAHSSSVPDNFPTANSAPGRAMVRHVLSTATRCFFHVLEEPVGTYALRVQRHVLTSAGRDARTGCDRSVDPLAFVTVTNQVVVDRSWCRTCADIVAEETRRRLGEARTAPVDHVRPLTREVP